MAANEKEFTLVGKFDDQITKKLKAIGEEVAKISKPLPKDNFTKSLIDGFESANKTLKDLQKSVDQFNKSSDEGAKNLAKSIGKVTGSLEDATRSAGKTRDTVSQIGEGVKGLDSITESLEESARVAGKVQEAVAGIGEGVKGLDGISESLEEAARAAGRAQESVAGIGGAAEKATLQSEDLVNTLLRADALSKIGDGIAMGFAQGMNKITSMAARGAGLVGNLYKEAMEDEMSDIKAASGIQGSFGLAGYKGEFSDAQRMYKAYDREVSEMIKLSSAPTAKVVELQRYTLDTLGPLMLAAEGVKKGTAMKDISPKAIEDSAKTYGKLLEKVAILSQGTGSAGFRVAGGIEQLVTRGKIDTTIDFFTDNILLMQQLEKAGFAGRGQRTSTLMGKTDAERMKAMMEAFDKSMSGEATAAMATSLTGSLQALGDTITNPSAGILGMARTFGKETQVKVNSTVKEIYNSRIEDYQNELKTSKTLTAERKNQLEIAIQQAVKTRDQLTKEGEERISTPFQAMSFAFSRVIQALTNAISAIGPVWEAFAPTIINFTETVFGPLAENLNAIASNMRAGGNKVEGFGRIVGEIYKKIGEVMKDVVSLITSPTGAGAKIQSEFMKGFMSAFQGDSAQFTKAKENIRKGVSALIGKVIEVLGAIVLSSEMRPFVALFFGAMFGPPVLLALISGASTLALSGMGGMLTAVFKKLTTIMTEGAGKSVLEKAAKGLSSAKANTFGRIKELAQTQYKAPIGPVPGGTFFKGERTAFMRPGLSNVGRIASVFQSIESFGTRFTSFFKGFLGKLAIVGAAITTITSLFQGKGLAESLAQGAGPLLGAALGAALIPFLGPFGPMIGSIIGGWIGSLEPVTSFLTGAFTAVGQVISSVGNSLGGIFTTFGENLMSLWSIITSIFPGLEGLGSGFSALRAGVLAVNVLLFPLTATLDLVNVGMQALRIGMLQLQLWISKIPGMGFVGESEEIEKNIAEASRRLTRTIDENSKKYAWEQFSGATLGAASSSKNVSEEFKNLQDSARKVGSTFENNKQYIDENGKKWGWATLNNEKVMVKWGGIAGESLKKVSDSAEKAASKLASVKPTQPGNYTVGGITYDWKTGRPVSAPSPQPRMSGLTPSASDMAWYRKESAKVSSPSGAATREVSRNTAQTASNTRSFNQTASAILASSKNSIQSIEKGNNNTQTSNRILAAISGKLSSIPSLYAAVARVYGLLASGGLNVKTNIAIQQLPSPTTKAPTVIKPVTRVAAKAFGEERPFMGNLAEAINFEMAHKPPGSHLVIANSSEKILPALQVSKEKRNLVEKLKETSSSITTNNLSTPGSLINNFKENSREAAKLQGLSTLGQRESNIYNNVNYSRVAAKAFGEERPFMGNLAEAINFEMAHKPPGSHLVIANSSETVIPAANGFGEGMGGVISAIWGAAQQNASAVARNMDKNSATSAYSISRDMERNTSATVSSFNRGMSKMSLETTSTFSRGFSALDNTTRSGSDRTARAIQQSIALSDAQTRQIMSAIKAIPASRGFGPDMGGILGNAPGNLAAAANAARRFGLSLTSFKRSGPASASYHNVGRAMDFSNSTGPTPQMAAFARYMAANHGSKLSELIYTPLGYSIKHGRRVPPIAASTHYNHVHVAYALGPGKPALFSSLAEAQEWERKMIPSSLKVQSITTNSGELPSAQPSQIIVNQEIAPGFEQMGRMVQTGQEKVASTVERYLSLTVKQGQQTIDAIRTLAAAGGLMGDGAIGSVAAGPGGRYGMGQLAGIARSVGFRGQAATIMAGIAMAESGGNPRAHNPVPPDNSYGLWQINMLGGMGPERRRAFGLRSNNDLFDPMVNAKAAYSISGGGTNFRPWTTYTGGAYKKFMHAAYALGPGKPAFFPTEAQAVDWENRMVPEGVKVKTITTNSSELASTPNVNVSVNADPSPAIEKIGSIVQREQERTSSSIERYMSLSTAQNQQILQSIKAASAAGGFLGKDIGINIGVGAGAGGVKIAGALGNYIKSTGGAPGSIHEHPWHGGVKYRHSPNSYHYSGRAIDIGAYANEQGGVISRVNAFNSKLKVKPVEFLHAGNDKGHQDHVHVAYALGAGNPALFSNLNEAREWEKRMIPSSLKVQSITTNSSEITPPPAPQITVNQAAGPEFSEISRLVQSSQERMASTVERYMSLTTRQGQQTLDAIRSLAAAGGLMRQEIPSEGGRFGAGQLASLAQSVGFKGQSAAIMAGIAMAESSGNPRAHNPVPPDNSYGLWQINMLGGMGPERRKAFNLKSNNDLFDPVVNAKAAYSISSGGSNFQPWSTYTNGAYKKFLAAAKAFGEQKPFVGNLAEAINFELANKPPGSHLVIANSSETIIPAAAYGFVPDNLQLDSVAASRREMPAVPSIGVSPQLNVSVAADPSRSVERISNILQISQDRSFHTLEKYVNVVSSLSQENTRTTDTVRELERTSKIIEIGQDRTAGNMDRYMSMASMHNQQILQAIKAASAAGGFLGKDVTGGLESGAGTGGVRIAGMLGNYIKSTGGAPGSIHEHPWHGGVKYKHSPTSYHYQGRAIDLGAYANEQAGVISRITAFNAKMGVNPVEFLHAGNRKDHQDHVHVAYALGKGRPAFFSSQAAAENWERKMVPSSLKVKTVTTNSGERGFGSTSINAPITIYQQPNQDPEELASIVAYRISMAVEELRNHA